MRRVLALVGVAGLSTFGLAVMPGVASAGFGASFSYQGESETWTVPEDVCEIQVVAWGAEGGDGHWGAQGGLGGQAEAVVDVVPGEDLTVTVGGQGGATSGATGGTGGFNGGGAGGSDVSGGVAGGGGGGGGMTDLRRGAEFLVAAGGGGGGGGGNGAAGGAGGDGGGNGTDGADAEAGGGQSGGNGGLGGTTGGGEDGGNGGAGTGGAGGNAASLAEGGGGGGGGYVSGGGGGGGSEFGGGAGGGGGGEGFTPDGTGMTNGANDGNGALTITYEPDPGCDAPVDVTITGQCPPEAGYEITVDNPRSVPVEIDQDGEVLGQVLPYSSQTFHSDSGSDNITATDTTTEEPVDVTVTVIAVSCVVELEPNFTG